MAKSRRRNKRNTRKIVETISSETFKKIVVFMMSMIVVCVAILGIRIYQDKKQLAEQREMLEASLAAIFEAEEVKQEDTAKEEEEAKDIVIEMAVVGDILCGNGMLEDAKNGENYDFTSMFGEVEKYVKTADIAIGTMETNFTDAPYSGYAKYNAPKTFAEAVRNTGIDIVSISHNHSLDYGLEGLQDTKETLTQLAYETVGTKTTLEDKNYTIQDVKGVNIAFLAYTYGFSKEETISAEEKQYVNVFDIEQAKSDIAQAKQEGAEYVCIIMHWGEINSTYASDEQKQIADELVQNGANIIVGSHPAVIEPMEIKQNAEGENCFVSYSVGNYISSLGYEDANLEMILNIQIRKCAEDGKIVLEKVTYTPIYVLDNGSKAENQYTLVDMKEMARRYANGETDLMDKKTYNKLVAGVERLEEIIRRK